MPTYRSVKGSNLTPDEVDANFLELRTDLDDFIANPPTADSVVSVTQSGFDLTFHTTLGSDLGPLTMPVVQFRWRGEWQPLTLYDGADMFSVSGVGLFTVMEDHTSAATFDAAATGGSPAVALYNQIFGWFTGADVVTETGTTRTLALADAEAYIRTTNGTAVTVTIPPNADVAFGISASVAFEQAGAGAITFVAGAGVTLNVAATHTLVTNGQFAVAEIKQVAADEWTLFGNLVPA